SFPHSSHDDLHLRSLPTRRSSDLTGGRMIQRTPNDPAWYKGGLYHDDMPFDIPAYWFMSWYDVSVGPNLELFNIARRKASPEVRSEEHTSELQSRENLVCRLLLEK